MNNDPFGLVFQPIFNVENSRFLRQRFRLRVLFLSMLRHLIASKVLLATNVAHVVSLVEMSAHVIILVSNSRESHLAKLARVRFFARVSSHMHRQIASLIKFLLAENAGEEIEVPTSFSILKQT